MTLNQLKYYVTIVERRGFTKAAEELFVSQSALSKSIKALEQEFDSDFIDRNSKDFNLTPNGEIFYEYALSMLNFVDSKTREISQHFHSISGSLNIGIPPTSGSMYYHDFIGLFNENYPDVKLNIKEVPSKQILDELDSGKLDLGVILGQLDNDEYVTKKAIISEIVLVVSKEHELANRKVVSFNELKDEKFLMMSNDFMFRTVCDDLCNEAGFSPNVVFESSQWDLIYEMAIDNRGITFLPKPLIDKYPRNEAKYITLSNPSAPWSLCVAYKKDRIVTPQMKAFLNM